MYLSIYLYIYNEFNNLLTIKTSTKIQLIARSSTFKLYNFKACPHLSQFESTSISHLREVRD